MTKTKTRRQRGTGSIFRWKGRGPWWIKYYKNGVPKLESSKSTLHRVAEQLLTKRKNEIADGSYVEASARKVTVQELIDDLLLEYKNNGRKSIGHLRFRWRLHMRPYFDNMTAAQATSSTIARYVNQRKEQGGAAASINRELAILKRSLSLAKQCGKISTIPHIAMLKESNVRTGFLGSKDRDALANACTKIGGLWMRSLFECAYTFGWRSSELLGLKVRQIDLIVGSIRLEPGVTKNLCGRQVPLTPAVRELLSQCIYGQPPDAFVFRRENGQPVRDFRGTWIKVCAEAGVAGLLFHDLRRSAARNLRNAGVAEGVIQKIGGWKTRSMFDRYSIIDSSDISDALVKLEAGRQREAKAAEAAKRPERVEYGQNRAQDDDFGVEATAPALRRN
jgi:integrase